MTLGAIASSRLGFNWPTPSTTGYVHTGVTLTTWADDRFLTAALAPNGDGVFDGILFPEPIVIDGNNIVLRRCKVTGSNPYGIRQLPGYSGLTIDDVEITSEDVGDIDLQIDRAAQFEGGGVTVTRLYAHDTWRGVTAYADNVTMRYSWVGGMINPGDEHSSAFAANGGSDNVQCLYNFLECPPGTNASGCIPVYPEPAGGPNSNWLAKGNFIQESGEYAVRVGYTPSEESPNSNFTFVDNWFSTLYEPDGAHTWPVTGWDQVTGTAVWANNRWWDLRATAGGYTNKHGQLVASSKP